MSCLVILTNMFYQTMDIYQWLLYIVISWKEDFTQHCDVNEVNDDTETF